MAKVTRNKGQGHGKRDKDKGIEKKGQREKDVKAQWYK